MFFGKKVLASCWIWALVFALSACGGESGQAVSTTLTTSLSGTDTVSASSSSSSASGSKVTANIAPTITGTPVTTAIVGTKYSFVPLANDANGDLKVFSISGKPSWATFNTLTGELSGTPTAVSGPSAMVITVSDPAGATASLSFSLTVVPATSSVVLTWTAPVSNTDGSPLTDLTHYTVYYGTASDSLTNRVSVAAGANSATVNGLAVGTTYYFAIASVSNSGGEGDTSGVVSKTI